MLQYSSLVAGERRVQVTVCAGLGMLFALVALAPHNERALFVDGGGMSPAAFSAIAPDGPETIGATLRRFGWLPQEILRRAFAPPATLRPTKPTGSTTDQPDGTAFVDAGNPVNAVPVLGNQAAALDGPGAAPLIRFGGSGLGDGFRINGIGGATPGGGGSTPGEPVTTPTPTPTSPVPEPSTWVLLTLGFALVAVARRGLRRRRSAAIQA